MNDDTLDAMRDARQKIDLFLSRYGGGRLSVREPAPDLAPIVEAVDLVGRRLQQHPLPPELESASRAEVDGYVASLQQLNATLERLQPQLEVRRDVIRERLGKIRQALHWVDSFHQTRE
jgi:hypothetical protein